MFFKIAKEEISYTRTYINPDTEESEKVTLIPTGVDSGDPELINVRDKEQGITYNIDKTILNTEYQLESQNDFLDVKENINKDKEISGYKNVIDNIAKAPTKTNADLLVLKDNAGSELDPRDMMSEEDVNGYFLIYKKLLNENYDIFEIAKANSKVNEEKKPEYFLYDAMKNITAETVKEFRDNKKKEALDQMGDVPITLPPNTLYNKVYNKYLELKKKYNKYDRNTIVKAILERMSDREELDPEVNNLKEFNDYMRQMFYVYLEKLYIKNKGKINLPKNDLVNRIVGKVKSTKGQYEEECDSFNIDDFNKYINQRYDDIAESILKLTDSSNDEEEIDEDGNVIPTKSNDKREVFNLIRERAIKNNPELAPLKNKITISGFESVLDTDNNEYNYYGTFLRKVIQIIKSVDPKLTVVGLINCFANYIYGNLETKKASLISIIPILKIAVGIEIITKSNGRG